MSLAAFFKGKGPSGFGYGTTAEQVSEGLDLSGKTYLLTGCNSGIGKETLRVLGLRGAHVIAAARTVDKAQQAIEDTGVDGTAVACELSEPDSVRACVQQVGATGRTLDGIVCNAGIMALPELEKKHGYEKQFFTNHMGHFLLVTSLVDQLADDGRVVMVSSDAHNGAPPEGIQFDNLDGEKGYKAWANYGQSKLANLLFANELAKRFEGTNKTANSLHPGVIQTNLTRNMRVPFVNTLMSIGSALVLKSIPQGAATTVYAATHPSMAGVSGKYLADCNEAKCSRHGHNDEMAQQLWQTSERIAQGHAPG